MKDNTVKKHRKKRKHHYSPGPPYPEYVNVLSDDGAVNRIRWSTVLCENEYAITDDIVFAYKCHEPQNYLRKAK